MAEEVESIYNLIPRPVEVLQKPPHYTSKHDPSVVPTFSTFGLAGTSKPGYDNCAGERPGEFSPVNTSYRSTYKKSQKSHGTFGTIGNAKKPTEITAKGSGLGGGAVPLAEQVAAFSYADVERKPLVPSRKECEAAYQAAREKATPTKNFTTANAVENILSQPKKSPEEVNWMKKPHFGASPPYLSEIKREIEAEYEYIRKMQEEEVEATPGMRQLGEDERLELVDHLKTKWDEVNKVYQQTSVLSLASLDTIGKVKRKEMYEAQLAQLEKDIEKLSKPVVFVAVDE